LPNSRVKRSLSSTRVKRIFLVGAPRSGTTIFQSLLAAHPEITSFPETKFFHYLWEDRLSRKLPDRLYKFFHEEIHRPDLYDEVEIYRQSTTDQISWFIRLLDKLTVEQGNDIWLEKTPEHVYFIADILHYLPEAKFIHIIRHPLDVVASMRKATQDPMNALWGGEWSLDFCISRWNSSVLVSCGYLRNPQHLIVKYEDLLTDKTKVLARCCHFIGISCDFSMVENYRAEAIRLGLQLPWHKGIERPIKPAGIPKYKDFFSEKEIEYVLKNTFQLRQRFGYKCDGC
jgi:hypothetical protein